jgi:hypothetical protein
MTCTDIQLTANVAGQTYDLNDGVEIRLLNYDLGLPATRRLTQRFPGQTGATNLGGVTAPRFADIFWAIRGGNKARFRELRETFLDIWRNRQTEATQLIFEFEDGRQRALDLFLDGELNWTEEIDRFAKVSGVFFAPDPRLYDPTLRVVTFALADANGLPIPFVVPIPMGRDNLNIIQDILYANGNRLAAAEFPLIVITGPLDNPAIENITTNERISFTGLSLAAGEFVVIDLSGGTRRDAKTLRNQDGQSVSNFLDTDSDLFTWHLAHAGELLFDGTYSTGLNEIRVLGTGATLQSSVSIRYYDRYEAI